MCGRFNIISDPLTQFIMQIVNGELTDIQLSDRFNIAPTEDIPVLRQEEPGVWEMVNMRWWLVPFWAPEPSTKYTMFNAKSETLDKSLAFKEPFAKRRCIVPASGYYEWRKEGGVKVPYLIQPDDESGFAFAGLWDRWKRGDQIIESCTIVTGAAPDSMAGIHSRIPIHLAGQEIEDWLGRDVDKATLTNLLSPHLRMPLAVTPVSSYVNNARHKDERCIQPLGERLVVH